jgi:hypothetical protein
MQNLLRSVYEKILLLSSVIYWGDYPAIVPSNARDERGLVLEKGLIWIVIIAIGVFIGIYAYGEYQEYRLELATRQALEEIQIEQQRVAEQMKLRSEQNRQSDIRKNTLCALNEDTGKCTCIHKKTGMKVSKTQAECQAIVTKGVSY